MLQKGRVTTPRVDLNEKIRYIVLVLFLCKNIYLHIYKRLARYVRSRRKSEMLNPPWQLHSSLQGPLWASPAKKQ
jgi:hypothetical protein